MAANDAKHRVRDIHQCNESEVLLYSILGFSHQEQDLKTLLDESQARRKETHGYSHATTRRHMVVVWPFLSR